MRKNSYSSGGAFCAGRLNHKNLHEHASSCPAREDWDYKKCNCDLLEHRRNCLMSKHEGVMTAVELDYLWRECDVQDIEVNPRALSKEVRYYVNRMAQEERMRR